MAFNVGDAIARAMSDRGDVAVAHSVFHHPWPGATIEQGFGALHGYFWDNLEASGARLIIHANTHDSPSDPTRLVEAIDVSSHQSRDLAHYVELSGAKHVIVRMYMEGIETPSPNHSVAQINSARALGCSVGTYGWLYTDIGAGGPRAQVEKQLETALKAQVDPPVLWQDIEHYEGQLPTAQEIDQALDECARQSVQGGIYSSKTIWDEIGSPSFPGTPLWIADWDGIPDLNHSQAFGDMVLVAKQYTSQAPDGSPLDRDVVQARYTEA